MVATVVKVPNTDILKALKLRVNNETDKFKVWEEARHGFNFIPRGCYDLTR